jgi:hypothetical protein
MRQSYPDFPAIDQKLDVYGVGVPRGNSDDQGLIDTMHLLFRPAIGGYEVRKHS